MTQHSGKHWANTIAKQGKNKEKPSKVLNWLSVKEAWNTVLRQQQYLYDRSMATTLNTDCNMKKQSP